MAQADALLSLALGAALVGVFTRIAIPPATWIALTLLVHASRSMPAWPGLPLMWVAVIVRHLWLSETPFGLRRWQLSDADAVVRSPVQSVFNVPHTR